MDKKNYAILIFYVILYLVLIFSAITPAYVEGDDASTILYHLLGRDTTKQMYYGAYQSGFDFVLKFLPSEEQILLKTAIIISFVAGLFVLMLSYYWISKFYIKDEKQSFIFGILYPFLIPELLFQSLLYNPTNVGFMFCLLGLIGFEDYFLRRKKFWFLLIPLFFMIGIPFRWSLIIFLAIPVGTYFIQVSPKIINLLRDIPFIVLLLTSFIASLIGIYISGFNVSSVIDVITWGNSFMETYEPSISGSIAPGISLFTPAFIILFIFGIVKLLKKPSKGIWIFSLLSILPFFILGIYTSLKYLITALPFFLIFLVAGLKDIQQNRIVFITFLGIILIPWILGLQVKTERFSWGPGFEAQNWKNQVANKLATINPDKREGELKISISLLKGGFALPTAEGPRPAYGYFQTLFGGDWRALIIYLEDERLSLVRTAIKDNYPIMQDRKTAYNQVLLYRMGMSTNTGFIQHDSIYQRLFTNNLDTVEIMVPVHKQDEHFIDFWSRIYGKPYLVYTSYSHILTNSTGRNDFRRLGAFTGYRKPE